MAELQARYAQLAQQQGQGGTAGGGVGPVGRGGRAGVGRGQRGSNGVGRGGAEEGGPRALGLRLGLGLDQPTQGLELPDMPNDVSACHCPRF